MQSSHFASALLVALAAASGCGGDDTERPTGFGTANENSGPPSGKSLWITSENAGAVFAVDPASGSVWNRIPVGSYPTDVAVGHDAVWVADAVDGTVSRINPVSGGLQALVRTRDARGLAIGEDVVWVSRISEPSLVAIDPDTNEVVDEVRLDRHEWPAAIAELDSIVYAEESYAGRLLRIDPRNGSTETLKTDLLTDVVAVGEDVFAAGSESVLRVDAASFELIDEYEAEERPWAIAPDSSGGSLWVAYQDPRVGRLDLSSGEFAPESVETGDAQSYGIAVSEGSVWVVDESGGLYRIDPETTTLSESYKLPGASGAAAIAAG